MFKRGEDKQGEEGSDEKHLVIIQCDSGHLHGNLIACARNRIYDLRAKTDATHVLFIIHLPRQASKSSFVGFQGHPWISSHIDDPRPPSDTVVSTKEAIEITISELFLGQTVPKFIELRSGNEDNCFESEDEYFDAIEHLDTCSDDEFYETMEIPDISSTDLSITASSLQPPCEEPSSHRSPLFRRLHTCIHAAASRLKDTRRKRSTKRVEILIHLIPKELPILPG